MNLSFTKLDLKVLKISLPLIVSNITVPLVGLVDNIMMGHLGSEIFIGAIGVGSIIISYILFSFGFVKSITTGFVSQSEGSSSNKDLIKSIIHIFFISMIISSVILIFRNQIIHISLSLFSSSSEILSNSKLYLEYRIWSVPAIFIRDILIGYYIGVQKTMRAMIIIIYINVLNIILDYLFVVVLGFSIEGVAIASLIAEYSILIFVIHAIYKEKRNFKNQIGLHLFNNSLMKKIFVNIDMFTRSLILMTCFMYFMLQSASYGNIALATNTVLLNFFFIFSYGIDGIAHASEVLVGNSVGKRDKSILINSILVTGKYSFFLMLIIFLIFISTSDLLISHITNLEILRLSIESNILWLYGVFVFATVAFWLDGVYIGLLDTRLIRNVMILSGTVFFSLEMFVFESTNDFLWISFLIFFLSRSLFMSIHLFSRLKNYQF